MAYNQFTTAQLEEQFHLEVTAQVGLFATSRPAHISELLRLSLATNTDMALRIGTEKARSEYLIAPILAEVYQQMQERVNLFSGMEFNVDVERGLSGYCDYLFSLAPLTLSIKSPVLVVVEAKKDDLAGGIPQCLAELVAAQEFNERMGRSITPLYGVVTTGSVWKFLRLNGVAATVDSGEYFLDNVESIVGVLLWMLHSTAA